MAVIDRAWSAGVAAATGALSDPAAHWVSAAVVAEDLVGGIHWATASEALAEELKAYLRPSLSGVKMPRQIDFREELPRHATGKLYKRLLRDEYWDKRYSKLV